MDCSSGIPERFNRLVFAASPGGCFTPAACEGTADDIVPASPGCPDNWPTPSCSRPGQTDRFLRIDRGARAGEPLDFRVRAVCVRTREPVSVIDRPPQKSSNPDALWERSLNWLTQRTFTRRMAAREFPVITINYLRRSGRPQDPVGSGPRPRRW